MRKVLIVDGLGKTASLVRVFSERISHDSDVDVFTTRPRDSLAFSGLENNKIAIKYFGCFRQVKVVRLFYVVWLYTLVFITRRRYAHVYVLWRSSLFLDAFLAFVYGDSASLFEHNVVEHDTDRVLVSQKVLWRLFSHVILLSGHSLEKYCTLSRRSNGLLLQHPLIDGEAPRDSFPRITVPRFAFVGASRGNRGLKCLLNIFGSLPSLELVVFSCVDEEVRRLVKKMNNVTIVSGYLDRDMFQNILKQDYVFVLPYIESTQSGIFYSLLSNRSVFVATNTGDVGRKMGGGKLNKCFFDLGSASSFLRAVQYLESDECLMRFEELRSLVERDFDHGYIALKNKTVIDVKN